MATYLLIHGAFRGAWAWDRVAPLLEQAGHSAVAIDLPFAGESWTSSHPVVTLAHYTNAILEAARQSAPVIGVGHSQGGFMLGAAAGADPTPFTALAYLDAPQPVDGLRAVDIQPPAAQGMSIPDLDPADEIAAWRVEAGPHMSDEDATFINERLTPQPVGPSLAPVATSRLDSLTEHFCFCEPAGEFLPARHTQAQLDERGQRYTTIEAHHDAPITAPELVAEWLLGLSD